MQKNKNQANGFGFYWKAAFRQMRKVSNLAAAGMLSALGMVLRSFVIPLGPMLRVGFSFLAVALSGYLSGPIVAGFAGMVVDLLGYLINPGGAYFFGFTISAFVNGVIYGLWLWNRPVSIWRSFGACMTSILLVSFLLNPLWLSIQYGEAWLGLLVVRIPKNIIMLPINSSLLYLLLGIVQRIKSRLTQR